MDLQLTGKRALVAGASRGLGYAVARGLAREGARIGLNGRDVDRLSGAVQALVQETGAQVVVSACQQCVRTLTEAARKNKIRLKVMDISELVLQAAGGE